MRNPIPRVAAIHDLAGFARTSLTAAIPILSSMGIQATPLPTAILSTQTVGYDDFTLLDLTDDMVRILDDWERLGLRFDGVYSGFMASTAQMDSAARCIRNCLAPGGLAVVDPVLGDDGKLIPTMTPDMVEKMRWLITRADVITPNFTEVCLLRDEPYASVLTGSLLQGDSLAIALDRAVQFVTLGIRATFGQGLPNREGILLERILDTLRAPLGSYMCRLVD